MYPGRWSDPELPSKKCDRTGGSGLVRVLFPTGRPGRLGPGRRRAQPPGQLGLVPIPGVSRGWVPAGARGPSRSREVAGPRLCQVNSWTDGRADRHQAGLLSLPVLAFRTEPCMSHTRLPCPSLSPVATSLPQSRTPPSKVVQRRDRHLPFPWRQRPRGCRARSWEWRMEPGQPGHPTALHQPLLCPPCQPAPSPQPAT